MQAREQEREELDGLSVMDSESDRLCSCCGQYGWEQGGRTFHWFYCGLWDKVFLIPTLDCWNDCTSLSVILCCDRDGQMKASVCVYYNCLRFSDYWEIHADQVSGLMLWLRKINFSGQMWWLMPVIPASWEAEVGGSQGQEFKTNLANMVKPHLY